MKKNHSLPINDTVLDYRLGSVERLAIEEALTEQLALCPTIPMFIDGKEVSTTKKKPIRLPHNHAHILAYFCEGNESHVKQAIQASLQAKENWAAKTSQERSAIFLRAADLIAGKYRAQLNAATMLGQSKNVYQAEIDAACELIDFLRFNVYYVSQLESIQPFSPEGVINNLEYRPLEGFVVAITPFNFTAIAGNLPCAPALMGNTVVWKPAETQVYAAHIFMKILLEAGLPNGVINLIYADGPVVGKEVFYHPDFGGLHFTGSTGVFKTLWKTIGDNLSIYKSFPKIVGETGGKNFVLAHPSANVAPLVTALIRGAFEYQGQKCSAASRAYIPKSLWPEVKDLLGKTLKTIKMGDVTDFKNFINAVIDETSFDKISRYIQNAENDEGAEVLFGGSCDKSIGYFIEPTVILAKRPDYCTMSEELFGPVLTIYLYKDEDFDKTLEIVNTTSPYSLTGAIFAENKAAVVLAKHKLLHAAGNFYINDKPTGAVVNQQPFGGARASGTNDKAGSIFNLIRWVNPRTCKENIAPPTDYRYPFME